MIAESSMTARPDGGPDRSDDPGPTWDDWVVFYVPGYAEVVEEYRRDERETWRDHHWTPPYSRHIEPPEPPPRGAGELSTSILLVREGAAPTTDPFPHFPNRKGNPTMAKGRRAQTQNEPSPEKRPTEPEEREEPEEEEEEEEEPGPTAPPEEPEGGAPEEAPVGMPPQLTERVDALERLLLRTVRRSEASLGAFGFSVADRLALREIQSRHEG